MGTKGCTVGRGSMQHSGNFGGCFDGDTPTTLVRNEVGLEWNVSIVQLCSLQSGHFFFQIEIVMF